MMQWFSHCIFAYLITRRIICNSFSGGNGKKIVKATLEKYYPSWESGGRSCNIPPIYEEMVLKCLFTY